VESKDHREEAEGEVGRRWFRMMIRVLFRKRLYKVSYRLGAPGLGSEKK